MPYRYRWWWQTPTTTYISDPELCVSHLTFIQLNKILTHIELTLTMLNKYFVNKTMLYTTQLQLCCWNPKKNDFETLGHVHVHRIEYVSYRQGPYRIRIDTAADRIVPALLPGIKIDPAPGGHNFTLNNIRKTANDIFSWTANGNLTKLNRNDHRVVLYQKCENGFYWLLK